MTQEEKKALNDHYCNEFLPKEWFGKPGVRTVSEHMFFTAEYFAEWHEKQVIEKACKWLNTNMSTYIEDRNYGTGESREEFIEDFRKAMED